MGMNNMRTLVEDTLYNVRLFFMEANIEKSLPRNMIDYCIGIVVRK